MSAPIRFDIEEGSLTRSTIDALPEGVIIWGADKTLIYANDASREITGLPLPVGSSLAAEPRTIKVLNEQNAPADPASMPVYRAFRGEHVGREDMRYIKPTGEHRWLSVSANPVFESDNTLAAVVVSLRDISVRKSREYKLEFMVESAKILQFDFEFKKRLMEKAKLTVPKLADWCIMDVLDGERLERVAVVHRDPAQIERFAQFEKDFPRNEERPGSVLSTIKSLKPLFMRVVTDEDMTRIATSPEHLAQLRALNIRSIMIIPISSHGRGVGAMTLAHSESGRTFDEEDLEFFQEFCYHLSVVFDNARLFDEIGKRDTAKDIFLAALSHELRNPLAPIKSSLELLKMRELSVDVREDVDIIEHQFDHMARLLNDLLDVTRFTQDRIELSASTVELRRLVERALKSNDALIRKADITLHFAYPSGTLSVMADETRLEQAVSNLLSNAVKFTPAGGSIWVDISASDSDTRVTVRDNGTGIDPADLPHIFDMYYQGANKDTVNSGLGIGLLLVQRIANMHGGSVIASSAGLGTGSEFVLTLPLTKAATEPGGISNNRCLAYGLTILVVDDNAAAADALVRLLNKLGADARAAYSAHEALGTAQLDMIDLFLLDVGMPQMDGYELVRALRARGIIAPVVALTGYGLADDKQRALEAGFTSHLTKPIGLSDLNTMFEEVLAVRA